jgi:two-component system OmpR family response regulator
MLDARNNRRARRRESPRALTGALSHFGLATVLTVLEMERRTGVLELRGPDRTGRLHLREGQVVHAEVRDTSLRGIEAVCDLMNWVDGGFIFRVAEVRALDEVRLPTHQLLMEVARRADELAA